MHHLQSLIGAKRTLLERRMKKHWQKDSYQFFREILESRMETLNT